MHPSSSTFLVALSSRKAILGIADIPIILPPFKKQGEFQGILLESIEIKVSILHTLPTNTKFFLRPFGRNRYVFEAFSMGITRFSSFQTPRYPDVHFAFYGPRNLSGSPWYVGPSIIRDPGHYVDCTLGRKMAFLVRELHNVDEHSPTFDFIYVKDPSTMELGNVIIEPPWKSVRTDEFEKEELCRIRAFDPIHKKLYVVSAHALYCLQY